jgi:hypothetical protein
MTPPRYPVCSATSAIMQTRMESKRVHPRTLDNVRDAPAQMTVATTIENALKCVRQIPSTNAASPAAIIEPSSVLSKFLRQNRSDHQAKPLRIA